MTGRDVLRRHLILFINSLKYSVDHPQRFGVFGNEFVRADFAKMLLLIEEAKIQIQISLKNRNDISSDQWILVENEFLSFIERFYSLKFVSILVLDMPFKVVNTIFPRKDIQDPIFLFFKEEKVSVGEAISIFRQYIERGGEWRVDKQPKFDFFENNNHSSNLEILKEISPQQQVAPVQFEVISGKIYVISKSPELSSQDHGNIGGAIEYIIESGERLVLNLEGSNCDKRLIDSVRDLHGYLSGCDNIVKIGLANTACGMMCSKFEDELPDAISAMFISYCSSISMYISQFPEWKTFTQNAAQVKIGEEDILQISESARNIIGRLMDDSIADPEVPKTISFVHQILLNPGATAKRAAFAMIKTIENLISSITRHAVDLLNKTTSKTVEGMSTVASKVIISLLGVALLGATGIGPAAVQVGAPWVKQAAEVVQREISRISGER